VCLAREARDAIGIERELLRQDFQRDVTSQLRIARPIHLAHSARTERNLDLVGTDASAGGEGHRRIRDIINEQCRRSSRCSTAISG
jgi:hypothetical protein